MEVVSSLATTAQTRVVAVDDATHTGEARRLAATLARQAGLGEEREGRLAVVVTELATNLVKHAKGGQLLLRAVGASGVEVMAVDRGPGIPDVARALNDGFSTAHTPGTGLGAVRRMAAEFDLYSRAPGGTVVMARLWADAPAKGPMALGAVCISHPGEEVAGDDWGVRELAGGCSLMVADGLGHGPLAREAAQTALSAFRTASLDDAPARTIEDCHTALRATRGAAVALARIDAGTGLIRYAGVGNIAAAVFDGAAVQRLVSLNGTAGLGVVRAREFSYPWTKGSTLVMTSDGLQTRWSLGDHPGLGARDPSVIAAVLYRDHARGKDDATAVVVKERGA
jgi:anti-sigma regulatory factor (Ser/Thr protein kinase)